MGFTIRSLAIGLPTTLMALCACGGPPSSPAVSQLLPASSAVGSHVVRDSATLRCRTLDDAEHPKNNWLIGINNMLAASGYFVGRGSNRVVYYVAVPPYSRHDYRYYRYPQGVVITSLVGKTVSGYVVDPPNLHGIWGFVEKDKVWTLFRDRNEGKGADAVTEILGFDGSDLAVGFYVNSSGVEVPFEVNVVTEAFVNLKPPGAASAQATAVNGKGDIVGWSVEPSGDKEYRALTGRIRSLALMWTHRA